MNHNCGSRQRLREPRTSAIGTRLLTGIGGVAFGNDTNLTLVHVASDR
jgi:hypothetical protein